MTDAEGDALWGRLVVLFEGARVTLVETLRKAGIPLVEPTRLSSSLATSFAVFGRLAHRSARH